MKEQPVLLRSESSSVMVADGEYQAGRLRPDVSSTCLSISTMLMSWYFIL